MANGVSMVQWVKGPKMAKWHIAGPGWGHWSALAECGNRVNVGLRTEIIDPGAASPPMAERCQRCIQKFDPVALGDEEFVV